MATSTQTSIDLPNVSITLETDPKETITVPRAIATNDTLLLQALVTARPQLAGATIERSGGTIKVNPKIKRNG
jgi:hypothetical protein